MDHTLWRSEEGRGRWLAAMGSACTPGAVALGVSALRAHCGRFAPLAEQQEGSKKSRKRRRDEALALTEGFYHAEAFASSKRARKA